MLIFLAILVYGIVRLKQAEDLVQQREVSAVCRLYTGDSKAGCYAVVLYTTIPVLKAIRLSLRSIPLHRIYDSIA